MSCTRGKAAPDAHTKLRLFADSAGYCQNPDCNENLFLKIGASEFHIAEMAHIISAGDKGPRTQKALSKEEKGNFFNLILLCPTCHTKIDKAEKQFSDKLILEWKNTHGQKISKIFNIKKYGNRTEVRQAVLPILNENKTIFETYGPMTDERFNPESEMPKLWLTKVHHSILPNNRKLLMILEGNYSLMTDEEKYTFELFKQHVSDFEARHINKDEINGIQFPVKLQSIFIN